jgi:hypothetical protein
MIITEKQANRKLQRKFYRSHYKCPFCNTELYAIDEEQSNVGYVKSKLSEVFFIIHVIEIILKEIKNERR